MWQPHYTDTEPYFPWKRVYYVIYIQIVHTYLHSFFSLLLLWDILHLLKMVIYTSYSNEIIAHTHTWELLQDREKKKMVEESISMFGFFRVQKDFYGATLNGYSGEKRGLIWSTNWEHIARQLHHSIKRQYRNLEVD